MTKEDTVSLFSEIPTFIETWAEFPSIPKVDQIMIIQSYCLLYLEKHLAEPLKIKYNLFTHRAGEDFLTILYQFQNDSTENKDRFYSP